jgi:glycosyltransferase involved in cell wall biosynthesis
MDVGKEFILSLPNAQQVSDVDINLLYNACDIGLNTCEGEGFGLCQFEHAAIGCPQVAANIGGFKEFLIDGVNSTLVEAKWRYHIDKQRDGIGGMAEVCDPMDVAEAIWKYYSNPKLVVKHGNAARKNILTNYSWEPIVNILHRILGKIKSTN